MKAYGIKGWRLFGSYVLKVVGCVVGFILLVVLACGIISGFFKGIFWALDNTVYYDEDQTCHHEHCKNLSRVYTVTVREMTQGRHPTYITYHGYDLRNLDGENCTNVGGVNFYKGIVMKSYPSGNLVYINQDDVVSVSLNPNYVVCREKHEKFFQWIVD